MNNEKIISDITKEVLREYPKIGKEGLSYAITLTRLRENDYWVNKLQEAQKQSAEEIQDLLEEKKKMEKKIDNYNAILELANPEDKEYLLNKFKEIFGDTKELEK